MSHPLLPHFYPKKPMDISFTPLADRIVIKLDPLEEKVGNVLVPVGTQKKEKPRTGEVLKLGEGVDPEKVPVGAKVVFGKYAGTELLIDGMDCLIVKQGELVGIL